jgi:ABC-type multidrug transport system permease subunit
MNSSWIITIRIALQFMRRDFFIHARRIHVWLINYSLLKPILYSLYIAYIQARVFFGAAGDPIRGTTIFAGEMLFVIFPLTYHLMIPLLYDLEGERFIDYQIIMLKPQWVIIQRIFFSSLFTFAMAVPFFPISKLILGANLATENTQWVTLCLFLYLCCLAASAYHMLAACALKNSQGTRMLWARINIPLIFLGGMSVPLYIVKLYSPLLGAISYANPVIYMSEGLRQALLGADHYLPILLCVGALGAFTLLFTLSACYYFKKRVDHI